MQRARSPFSISTKWALFSNISALLRATLTDVALQALRFSALLRQPESIPEAERLAYVNEVVKLLDKQEYAHAVVGVLGESLNVEQPKRLNIGVELVAKPPLQLFLNEPTSALDSQTSQAVLDLLEEFSKADQSTLCIIHQPSAMLFQRFDRLLFLADGGETLYLGQHLRLSHCPSPLVMIVSPRDGTPILSNTDPCPNGDR